MPKIVILFLLVYLYAIIMAIFSAPVWGIYIYEIVYFFNPGDRWWSNSIPNLSYSFIVVIITLLLFMVKFKDIEQNTIKEMPAFKWFFLLLIMYSLVSFAAIIPSIHNKYLIELYKLFLFTFVGYKLLSSEKKIEFALYAFIIGGAYIGYETYNVGRDQFGRVEGIGLIDMPDSNGTSASMVPTIPLLMYFFLVKGKKAKLLLMLAGGLIANGLILINSRGAFLGVLAGVLYFMGTSLFTKYKLPNQRKILALVVIGGLSFGALFIDDVFWERMQTIEDTSSEESNKSGARRINFWVSTFDMLDDNPAGLGIYGFQVLSPLYLNAELLGASYRKNAVRAVHSLWFQAMGEIGYFGFFIFLLLLYSVFRRIRKAKKYALKINKIHQYYLLLSIESGYIGFLVAGSFINAFRAEVHFWMLMFSLALCAVILRQKDTTNETQLKQHTEKAMI